MTRFRLSLAAVVALVLLRMVVGFHFYREGVTKLQSGDFSSAGMLWSAKGPLAPTFRSFVWDPYGTARLDAQETESVWASYRDYVIKRYALEKKWEDRVKTVYESHRRALKEYLDENASDIRDYRRELKRLDKYQEEAERQDVPSLRSQVGTLESEQLSKSRPWLAEVDRLWDSYEQKVAAVVQEATGRTPPGVPRPSARWLDTRTIDRIIPYFDTVVGVLLVLGLLTRTAAWAGALFLGSIIASQWPGAEGATPTYYQAIEMMALVALATVGAGRFGSLDAIIHHIRMRCCPPKRGENS